MKMMMKLYKLLVLLMFTYSPTLGNSRYGRCKKFTADEVRPDLPNGDRYCIRDGNFDYCRSFKCPSPGCSNPLTPQNGVCRYCPGTCSYGGSIYKVGDGSFPCLDGSNTCRCLANNGIGSTKIASSIRIMCRRKGSRGRTN